jgi:hypothetical protein
VDDRGPNLIPAPLPQEASELILEAPGGDVALRCLVRSRSDHPDGRQTIGVEFQPGQWPAIGALTHLLVNAGIGLDVVPELTPMRHAAYNKAAASLGLPQTVPPMESNGLTNTPESTAQRACPVMSTKRLDCDWIFQTRTESS